MTIEAKNAGNNTVHSPLYFCPICPLTTPGWLKYQRRNDHMRHTHHSYPSDYPKGKDRSIPNGIGLVEWREIHLPPPDLDENGRFLDTPEEYRERLLADLEIKLDKP